MKVSGINESVPRVQLRLQLLMQPHSVGLPRRKSSPKLMQTLGAPGSRAINRLFPLPVLRQHTQRSGTHRGLEVFRRERPNIMRERRQQRRQNDSESTIEQLTRIIDSYPTPTHTPDYLVTGRKLTPDDLHSTRYASISPFRQSVPYQVSKQ